MLLVRKGKESGGNENEGESGDENHFEAEVSRQNASEENDNGSDDANGKAGANNVSVKRYEVGLYATHKWTAVMIAE